MRKLSQVSKDLALVIQNNDFQLQETGKNVNAEQ